MRPDPDAWVTRGQAAEYLNLRADTIGKWHDRGWVDPATGERRHLRTKRLPGGRLRYRLGDILDAERATRNHVNSSRNPRRGAWADLDRKKPSFAPA